MWKKRKKKQNLFFTEKVIYLLNSWENKETKPYITYLSFWQQNLEAQAQSLQQYRRSRGTLRPEEGSKMCKATKSCLIV